MDIIIKNDISYNTNNPYYNNKITKILQICDECTKTERRSIKENVENKRGLKENRMVKSLRSDTLIEQ